MTRGQRAAHRLIWMVLTPIGAIIMIGAIVLRPHPVKPAELAPPPGATP